MTVSFLPWLLILIPLTGTFVVALLGFTTKIRYIREVTLLLFLLVTLVIVLNIDARILGGETLSAANMALHIDGLSALLISLIIMMVFLIALYSLRYMAKEREQGLTSEARLTIYYSLTLLFTATMMWTCTTNHMIMLYVSMEGTTLATAFLVAFYRTRASLEAGYKYILLVVVGITFALFGMVLIFAAVVPHLPAGARSALLLTEIGRVIQYVPKNLALLGVAFMVVGFGTKAGMVPFHAWLPDAHSEAPTPISALLSGLIIKIGAYALARTVVIFAPHYRAVVVFIAIMASAGMLVGIFLALAQDDLKRLLAYHSVSQIAYVFEGLGLGTYLGIYGGLFHLLNHTLFKGLLFLCAGAVMYATAGVRKISQLGGLARTMPITAFCFIIGAVAMGGLPPFNGFLSKFTIVLGAAQQNLYWAAAISILTGFLTLACMVKAAYLVFWQKPAVPVKAGNPELREVPFLMQFGMIVLALLCIAIGVYPKLVHPLLNSATNAILTIWGGPLPH